MAVIHKLEDEYKAEFSAEKFYAMMTRDAPKLPKYVPKMVHNVQVLPEDGEVRVGAVFVWDYVLGDKPGAVMTKVKVTAVDHINMSLNFTVIDGELTNGYTSFAITLTTTPQRDGNYNCLVKWSAQYQKANEDVPRAVQTRPNPPTRSAPA
ncbi:hypothetical protein MKX01_039837 [Papaver californicum]|nr:hypothetical protein MKX01_039837 [Papaver californicum]